jgi:hypothetical protein
MSAVNVAASLPTLEPLRVGYVVKRYPRYSETFIVTEILAHERSGQSIEIFALRPCIDTHFQDTLARVRALVARAPSLPLGWQLVHHQGAEDALAMARDEGWDERAAAFAPWARPGPGQHWGIAAITAIVARIEAHRGDEARAMGLLARPVRALTVAPAWAPNYTRTACEVAETLWLLGPRRGACVVRPGAGGPRRAGRPAAARDRRPRRGRDGPPAWGGDATGRRPSRGRLRRARHDRLAAAPPGDVRSQAAASFCLRQRMPASRKPSMNPSRTCPVWLVSWPVRRSLTIWYGCST